MITMNHSVTEDTTKLNFNIFMIFLQLYSRSERAGTAFAASEFTVSQSRQLFQTDSQPVGQPELNRRIDSTQPGSRDIANS